MRNDGIIQSYIHITSDATLEFVISRTIVDFGIPPHLRGYQYIRDALLIMMKVENNDLCVTKDIYPEIAKKYYTSAIRVERAIRHAIEISWDGHGKNKLKSYFVDSAARPTNSVFLDFICKWICFELENI